MTWREIRTSEDIDMYHWQQAGDNKTLADDCERMARGATDPGWKKHHEECAQSHRRTQRYHEQCLANRKTR